MKILFIILTTILLTGCYKEQQQDTEKMVPVTIVAVREYESAWRQDHTVYEVIETGYRFQRCGVLGSVGDTMKLKETQLNWNDGY